MTMPKPTAKGFVTLRHTPGAMGLDRASADHNALAGAQRWTLSAIAILIAWTACGNGRSPSPPPGASAPSGSGGSAGSSASSNSAGSAGSAGAAGSANDPSGAGESANDYVPAEFKAGASRWKDTGVYLDGKPIGFIQFGELPIALTPTWIKDKVSVDKPPDCPIEKCPGWKWSRQRSYKFTDYLKAVGVDLSSIKMLHVYGPKFSEAIAVTGRDLMSKAASDFTFRFGALVAGKPIPHLPPNFGNGRSPDKMTAVMIYVTKRPPVITRDGIELDGVEQTGVPYYGEPLRGGVRIYFDDRLVAIIKRQELDMKKATQRDGDAYWSFAEFLRGHGIDTSKAVEGWVIRDERRTEVIAWPTLATMMFSAGSKAHGGILLGDQALRANAIALHSRHILPSELPALDPEEQ